MRRTLFALSWLCASLPYATLQAETGTPVQSASARNERLSGLSKDDLTRLAPELDAGPVALIEFADMQADQLPAINVALHVQAAPQLLTRIISDPASYPRFMPTLDEVKIVDKHDHSVVYDWSFNLTVLHMSGRNVLTAYPAPSDRPETATRITIDSEQGDLGRGRFLFRIHPHGRGSLLVLSMRLDLRQANYVARQVAKAARSINRSANLALAFSMAQHLRSEAERQSGVVASKAQPRPLHKPIVDLGRLGPLLDRGDLLFAEGNGTRLDQVSVLGAVGQAKDKVQGVMHDANAFGSALVPGSKAEIVARDGNGTSFNWTIDLPIVGVSGRMLMQDQGSQMSVDAIDGALRGGRWLFDVTPIAAQGTLVTSWAHFDFSNSTWLLEKMADADPYLGQGMIGASQIMLLRAVRTRASQ